ncbi:oxidoreductase [Nocardia seriolae]|uniref:Oxidoreductase n=1 Tax=Nocardia seriolae TaxID=37332 RepID=A0A0B8NFL4_9NOCA|nr:oxidoreductase [Nocardia seriolae]APA95403.1 putative oxidoreductase [Nocardia seriolae]MTJ66455.1 SDR family NAD(P)-dependent oxidoreductase [Nocardia seriolae]MTJ76203.1 SDR family NAD(P)-dependent oxidoreductase [Nocardia seriolae]MTJ85647.1 SDR family NAD(P)-dependent oxidoreductase [Nocardia seriolae]MTK29644.1 SDR family NAD(P)-dependent oxidoreductase [Nocardia seriolae]
MGSTTPWTAADIPDLNGRTAIVTGASGGLGLETARQLAVHGARVVLACRNAEKAAAAAESIRESAPGAELPFVELDVAALASVRKAAQRIHDEFERVDLLVNNAGTLSRERTVTVDGFETTFGTNHLGPFAFTGLVLDLLRAAPHGRVVTVTSGVPAQKGTWLDIDDLAFEKRKYKGYPAYAQSKQANAVFALELQRQLNGTGSELISVLAHPGAAESDFAQNFGPAVAFLARPQLKWVFRVIMQTVEMGALPTLRAATDPGVRGGDFYGPTGTTKGYPVPNETSAETRDPELAARLWTESERLTGVTYRFGE